MDHLARMEGDRFVRVAALLKRLTGTTRARLVLLVAAILAPLATFGVLTFFEFEKGERAFHRDDAQALALQISSVVDFDIASRIAIVETLATSPVLTEAGDLPEFERQARALVNRSGYDIVLRDPAGQQLINTAAPANTSQLPRGAPAMTAADHLVFATRRPVITDLYRSRLLNRLLVAIDVPVISGGEVRYALSMGIEPEQLQGMLTAHGRNGWVVTLFDRSNRLIASSRRDPSFAGREVTSDLRAVATGQRGTWTGRTLDGTEVLGAYARSPVSGWGVAVGIPLELISAPLHRRVMVVVGLGLLLAIVGLLLAYAVAGTITRPIARLISASGQVARGGAVRPLTTGLMEVDRVAAILHETRLGLDARAAALKASEERFQGAVRSVDGVMWTNDAEGRMTGPQPGWAALTGQSAAEYAGFGWSRAVHPADSDRAVTAWLEAVRTRTTYAIEQRVRRADGVYRRFSVRAVPVLDADGSLREWVGVHTDITDEYDAKAMLAARELQLRDLNATLARRVEETSAERDRIWRISPELMIVLHFEGQIVSVNPAWRALLGLGNAEVVGTKLLRLVHPEDVAATIALSRRLEGGETALGFENRLRHRDGSYRWVSWTATPDAGLIHAIGRDVTAEKEAEAALRRTAEQLRQSQKMEIVGQLTGGIAHDFNNLLTVVSGHLEMAKRRLDTGMDQARLQRHLSSAMEGARRAAVLTHRLLAFSRQTPLAPQTVDLNQVVAGMTELIRRTLGENIVVATRSETRLWSIEADLNQIENAILNLCVNARDAMASGGTLTIETHNELLAPADPLVVRGDLPSGAYAVLSVTDTGTGIAAEIRERVFEPFFTTKPVGKGTGLGLSQVFGFMRQSLGSVTIGSPEAGGTTVRLLFPRAAAAAPRASTPVERAEAGAGHGELCLVVEDEDMVREFSVSALEEGGYGVIAAANGPDGLAMLDLHPEVKLLFTDIVLAGPLDGRATAEQALLRRPDLLVLFTTGYTRDAEIIAGRLDGEIEVITKPFTSEALLAKVSALLPIGSPAAGANAPPAPGVNAPPARGSLARTAG